jgi:hypothetical protein
MMIIILAIELNHSRIAVWPAGCEKLKYQTL